MSKINVPSIFPSLDTWRKYAQFNKVLPQSSFFKCSFSKPMDSLIQTERLRQGIAMPRLLNSRVYCFISANNVPENKRLIVLRPVNWNNYIVPLFMMLQTQKPYSNQHLYLNLCILSRFYRDDEGPWVYSSDLNGELPNTKLPTGRWGTYLVSQKVSYLLSDIFILLFPNVIPKEVA